MKARHHSLWAGGVGLALLLPVTGSAHDRFWKERPCFVPTVNAAALIHDCLGGVMFPRGLESGEKPEVEVNQAALLCRQVRSSDAGRSLGDCVRRVLYERSGLGRRREAVPTEAAVTACRYATSAPLAEAVEDCMRRMLFDRGGLGYQRTDVSAETAAFACQSVAPPPPMAWPLAPRCRPAIGAESVAFLEECMKYLLNERKGAGGRKLEITPEAAALACRGPLDVAP